MSTRASRRRPSASPLGVLAEYSSSKRPVSGSKPKLRGVPATARRIRAREDPQLLALDVGAGRRLGGVDDDGLNTRPRRGRVGAVAVVPVLPRDHVRIGQAHEAHDRVQVVRRPVLGQEGDVAGRGHVSLGVFEDRLLERLARRAQRAEAVVVKGEAGVGVAQVAVCGVGAEVEQHQRLVEDQGRRVDGADRVEHAAAEVGQGRRVEAGTATGRRTAWGPNAEPGHGSLSRS